MTKRETIPLPVFNFKPYKHTPHPMQNRIEQFRSVKSLVSGPRK